MSNTSSTHTIKVDDNGTLKATTKEAEGLSAALEKAARTASKVVQARAAGPSFAAAARGVQDGEDSGTARGIGGLTGAAGRDFAKQSEGLGGLVRLYATFAANIFAATAAFSALSKAADTTNMIEGLNQLGAASGQSLGAMSKRVMFLTGNAISLREAMEATVKATSSGLAGKDLERLAVGAKQASQALGVNMSDAVSRLTRGITKLEPELLDELGIFIRVDDAAKKYAKGLGVAVSSLSDVQRRAAFAAETLDQVERKFGNIKIEANPYTKLAASLANLAQVGLEFVNKFLTPIASILSNNMGLLAAVIGFIGVSLLKTAIPALSAWREGMLSAAQVAEKTAAKLENSFKEGFQPRWEAKLGIPALNKALEDVDRKIATLGKKASAGLSGVSATKSLEAPATVSTGDLTKQINLKQKAVDDLKLKEDAQSAAAVKNHQRELKAMEAYKAALLERKVIDAEIYGKRDTILQAAEVRGNRWYDTQYLAEKNLDAARRNSVKLTAVAAVAENTRIDGIRGALAQLNTDLKTGGVTGWRAWEAQTKGAVVAVATRVGNLISALGSIGAAIGVLSALGVVIYSTTARASKELDAASTAANNLAANAKTAKDALESTLNSDRGLSSLQTLSAISNILIDIGNNAKNAIDQLASFNKLKGPTDSAWEWVKGIFNSDLTDNIASSLADSFDSALKLADVSGTAGAVEARQNLAKALNLTATDAKSLKKAIEASLDAGDGKAKAAIASMDAYKVKIKETVDASNTLNIKFKEGIAIFQDINKSFLPTDNIAKLGFKMIEISDAFDKSIKQGPEATLRELNDIVGNTEKLSLVDEKDRAKLLDTKRGIESTFALVEANLMRAAKLEADINALLKDREAPVNANGTRRGEGTDEQARKKQVDAQIANTRVALSRAKQAIEQSGENTLKIVAEFSGTKLDGTFLKGADYIQKSLGIAFDKAALTLSKVALIGATGQAKTDLTLDFARKEANLQLRLIDSNILLARINEELLISSERRAIAEAQASGKITPEQATQRTIVNENRSSALGLNLNDILKSLNGSIPQAVKEGFKLALPAAMSRAGAQAQRQEVGAVLRGAEATAAVDTISNNAAEAQKALDLRQKTLDVRKQDAALLQQILGAESAYVLQLQQQLDTASLAIKQERDVANIKTELAANDISYINATSDANKIAIAARKAELDEIVSKTLVINVAEKEALETSQALAVAKQEFNKQEAKKIDSLKIEESLRQVTLARIDLESQMLGIRASLGDISAKDQVQEEAKIAGLRLVLDLRNQEATLLNAKEAKLRTIQQEEDNALRALSPGASTAGIEAEQVAKRKEVLRLYNAEYAAIQQINTLKNQGLAVDTVVKSLLAEQADNMAKLVSATESLATVFGDVGTAIGTSLQSLMAFGQTQEKYDAAKKTRMEKLAQYEESDPKRDELLKDQAKADKQNAKDQLTNMAKVAGATKKLFSEKTLAHKALAATEKTLHLIKLGMDIESIASDTIKTGKEILNSGARATMSGTEAVLDTLAAIPPPFGWVAAGITAAMVASLLGGKGPKVNMAGNTSADRQETQGTGMSWKDGKQVENGNGVFGDPTEKSDSVRKALEIMKDNTIEGLKYDRSMLDALQSIDRAISGVSKGLAAIPGIRTGSSFGTQEGNVGKGGIYYLFGSKTSQEITDAGIKVTGAFAELSKGMGSFLQYEDVLKSKTKSGFFGIGKSTSQSLSTNYKTLDENLSTQITDIFKNATGLFNTVAKDMGKSATYVAETLAQLPVQMNASLKGLSGKDLESAFNAVVSQQLDAASAALFSEMKKYAEFGEGLLETTVRVVDTNAKMKVAFDSIGITVANMSYDASESLAELAGGLSEFNDGIKFFSENFLTEAERLAPVQRNVSTTLQELATDFKLPAIAAINTREAFKALVLSLNPAEEQSAKLYSELIKLAPAFAETTPDIKDVVESLSKLLERANELQSQYDKLTMSEDAYAAKLRSVYKDKELLQYDANIAMEKEIRLLTERKSLKDKYSDLEVDLLRATPGPTPGSTKEQEAVNLSRGRELAKLDSANRKIQELIFARQDEISALNKLVTITASITSAMKNFTDAEKTARNALDATKTALAATAQSLKSNMIDTLRQLTQAAKDADQAVVDAKVALAQTAVELKSNIVASLREFTQAAKDADQAVVDARAALVRTALALRGSIVSALQEIRTAADSAAANLKSASDTIASSFLAARSAVEAADKEVASARDNIINSAQAAQQALNQAYFNVSQGLSQAEANLAAANKEVASAIEASKDELRGLAKGIREFIFSIASTDLGANSQATQLDILKKEFDSQSKLALLGDKEALSKIRDTAQSLLTLGKDQSRTSLEFATLTGTVSSTLDKIASATEATAGPATDPGLAAQQSTAIAAAEVSKWQQALYSLTLDIENKAGKDALDAVKLAAEASKKSLDPVVAAQEEAAKALLEVTKWQKALSDSGITGVATQKDLLEEYKLATAAQTDARAELKAWEDVVLKAGVDTAISSAISATKASILADTTKKAYDDWVLDTAANKTAQADLVTAINATKDIPQKQLTAIENLINLLGDYFTITNVLTPGELIDPVTNVLKDLNTSITNQKTATDNLAAATILVAGIVGTNDLAVTTQLGLLATLVGDYRLIASTLSPKELVVSANNVLKDLNTSITNQKTATDNLAAATAAVSGIITANDLLVKTDLENLAKLVEDYRLIASVLSPQEMMGSVETILKDYNLANGKWKTAYDELEEAKRVTIGITTTAEVTALDNLRKLVDDYNKEILLRDTARNTQSAAENLALITEIRAVVTAVAPTAATPTIPITVLPPPTPTDPGDFVGPIRPPGFVPDLGEDPRDIWQEPDRSGPRSGDAYRGYDGTDPRYPRYASGGDFSGGYRIVGENGPELEATGPSRIFSNRQTNDMFNNTELIAEIKELRKEVAALRSASVSTEYNTRKTNETFQQVTIGGQYMLTRAA